MAPKNTNVIQITAITGKYPVIYMLRTRVELSKQDTTLKHVALMSALSHKLSYIIMSMIALDASRKAT